MIGFMRIAAITPPVALAHPEANAKALLAAAEAASEQGAAVVVAPELSLTGATCGDLFLSQSLLLQSQTALQTLCEGLPHNQILICGVPVSLDGALYDCAAVLQRGQILGYVPRTMWRRSDIRMRCFTPTLTRTEMPDGTPIGSDLCFEVASLRLGVTFGLTAPSALTEAVSVMVALDATPEGCGGAERRRTSLRHLSATTSCAWVYCAAGCGESSTDGVYSGHRALTWEGAIRAEARWEAGASLMDIVPEWIEARRQRTAFVGHPSQMARLITATIVPTFTDGAYAGLRKNPFIPATPEALKERCSELLQMQVHALFRRFSQIRAKRLVLGLSGGLDSTLALVVCTLLCRRHNLPDNTVLAVTMPGFGTTDRTYQNAITLAQTLGAELKEISIVPGVEQHFKDIGHDPTDHSVTYENAQARARTYLLMDLANQTGGLLVGTGDLSEIALGWSTYNGDHMSMYSVNCSIPKTLIPHCLTTATALLQSDDTAAATALKTVLKDICDTPVSPELVPGVQHTESIVGRYELHDCLLWHWMRHGCDRATLRDLTALLFPEIPESERSRTLDIFCRRVISQQFKRSCSPDGPALGGIALSPRGGWMIPSDANLTL
ncbi:MAG: NAD(+) synthase [Kiritimatiellae bacterium]|nr:NAD(+) synthase [Kiritimatiellia bacterium]